MISSDTLRALNPARLTTVETHDGEQIMGRFDGAFSIDSQPERGVTGIQIAISALDVRYIAREDIADVREATGVNGF